MLDYIFYLLLHFSIITFAVFVVLCRNPVYSVLCLIMVFLNAAFFLVWFGVEFLALILVIVYAGAISILFLFIILLLNIRSTEILQSNIILDSPIAILIALKFVLIMVTTGLNWASEPFNLFAYFAADPINQVIKNCLSTSSFDVYLLTNLLYTQSAPLLVITSLILLTALVGAITLTKK